MPKSVIPNTDITQSDDYFCDQTVNNIESESMWTQDPLQQLIADEDLSDNKEYIDLCTYTDEEYVTLKNITEE